MFVCCNITFELIRTRGYIKIFLFSFQCSVIETQEAVTASVITTVTEKSAEDSANSQREYTKSLGSKQQQSDQAVGALKSCKIIR